jgi:hypothetical protein
MTRFPVAQVIGFLRGDVKTIGDIPLDLPDKLIKLNGSQEIFIFTPIILYIIKLIVNDFLKTKK